MRHLLLTVALVCGVVSAVVGYCGDGIIDATPAGGNTTFDAGFDGFDFVTTDCSSLMNPFSATCTMLGPHGSAVWSATDGNPTGCVQNDDPDGGIGYWRSPVIGPVIATEVHVDLRSWGGSYLSTYEDYRGDIWLWSPSTGKEAGFALGSRPPSSPWTRYIIDLSTANPNMEMLLNATDVADVLAQNDTRLYIRGEYGYGADVGLVDNVVIVPEVCDDGNADAMDGCDADCRVESGWQCDVPGEACTPVCGDAMQLGSEQCDDGNRITETCTYGETSCSVCDATCALVAGAASYCGNGIIDDVGPIMTFDLGFHGFDFVSTDCVSVLESFSSTCTMAGPHDSVSWIASGGNPGGHVYNEDPDNRVGYWRSPVIGPSTATELEVDLQSAGGSYFTSHVDSRGDIWLWSPSTGKEAGFLLGSRPGSGSWTHYAVDLTTANPNLEMLINATDVADVLAQNDTRLYIRGEYGIGGDWARLDNVVLIDVKEACDSGSSATDQCAYGLTSCYACDATCTRVNGTTSYCGDGIVDSMNGEECDDASDECSATCLVSNDQPSALPWVISVTAVALLGAIAFVFVRRTHTTGKSAKTASGDDQA